MAPACPMRSGGWLSASGPWVLGHLPRPGVQTLSRPPVATSAGQLAPCACTLASWGHRRALPLPSQSRSQAGGSFPGWLASPRVVLAYVPGGLAGPWGGLDPSQAGKGWGLRVGLQDCGPQAQTARALPRACGRRQRRGGLAFLPREEPSSGSHHTMVHLGPRRTGGQNGGTLASPPPRPRQGQWKAAVGQVPGRLAAGRWAATCHRGNCRGHGLS